MVKFHFLWGIQPGKTTDFNTLKMKQSKNTKKRLYKELLHISLYPSLHLRRGLYSSFFHYYSPDRLFTYKQGCRTRGSPFILPKKQKRAYPCTPLLLFCALLRLIISLYRYRWCPVFSVRAIFSGVPFCALLCVPFRVWTPKAPRR